MKHIFFLAGLALLASNCTNDINVEEDNSDELAPVTVRVNSFSVSQEEFSGTRAIEDLSSYTGTKAITLAFYSADGTEVYKATQLKESMPEGKTFGEFSLSLPIGNYTMVVIGRGNADGDVLNLTSPTAAAYTTDHVRETFTATQEVNITNCDAVNLTATLDRVIAKVQVVSTDNRTANVANIRMTFSGGGKDFNPTTGFALTNTGLVNTVQGSEDANSKTTATSYLFLATDEQTVDVTIETLDADGAVLFSKTVQNVSLRRNRLTKLTGAMYTNAGASASSFTLNTDWLDGNEIAF